MCCRPPVQALMRRFAGMICLQVVEQFPGSGEGQDKLKKTMKRIYNCGENTQDYIVDLYRYL